MSPLLARDKNHTTVNVLIVLELPLFKARAIRVVVHEPAAG